MLALDPKATWEYTLKGDADKPNPPRFVLRYISLRDYRNCLAINRRADALREAEKPDAAEGDAVMDAVLAAVKGGLVEIRNAPDPYRLDDLEASLTLREVWELFFAYVSGGRIAEDDKKNLPSPARGGAGESASDAQATSGSVATCPQPPSPLSCTTGGTL